jgi:AcrR family transcriptional regulator
MPSGSGKPSASDTPERKPRIKPDKTISKPLKRPSQARAKFTVQAIYDAFVQVWRSQGWDGLTTRAIALETGVSVGTLYEYFPNKHALLSGYVRHCMEMLADAIDRQVIQAPDLTWEQRVHRLVHLTCGTDAAMTSYYFDSEMLMLECQIAEPKHHRRVYEEMSQKWLSAIDACTDLPRRPSADTVKALYLSVLGGRRYLLLVDPQGIEARNWAVEMERLCCTVLLAG